MSKEICIINMRKKEVLKMQYAVCSRNKQAEKHSINHQQYEVQNAFVGSMKNKKTK